jgi:hypothetical protein
MPIEAVKTARLEGSDISANIALIAAVHGVAKPWQNAIGIDVTVTCKRIGFRIDAPNRSWLPGQFSVTR